MRFHTYRDIHVWKSSIELTEKVYRLTNLGLFAKDFALRDQLRRAMISISSNIAEGFERNNNAEFIRFLIYAKASAGEASSQLFLAERLGYVEPPCVRVLLLHADALSKSIGKLISYLKASKKSANPQTR